MASLSLETTGAATSRRVHPAFLFVFSILSLVVLSSFVSAVHYSLANESACPCQFATFKLQAENLGSEPVHQDFQVRTDGPISAQPNFVEVPLGGQERREIPFYVQAACLAEPGTYAVSLVPADGSNTVQASLRVDGCDSLLMSVTPQQTLCQNDHADYAVRLENPSDVARNVSLGTDLNPEAYVMPSSVSLAPHEKRTVYLSVNTNALPQRLPFKVVARSDDGAYVEQPALVDIQACTGVRVNGPTQVNLLEGQNQSVFVNFQNIGSAQVLDVSAFCPPFASANASVLDLPSSATGTVVVLLQSAPLGAYSCTLRTVSREDGRTYSHTFAIQVGASSARYAVTPQDVYLEQGVVRTVTFHVHDDGLLESVPVSFSSNVTAVFSGPTRSSQLADQDLSFTLEADCHAYGFELTHGGARRICPDLVTGNLTLGSQVLPVRIHVSLPSLVFDYRTYSVPTGVRVDYVVTNTGNATVLHLSGTPASRGPATVAVAANSQAFLSVFVDGNQSQLTTFTLQAVTDRGTYSARTDLTRPQGTALTGLVTLATPVMAFSLAVLLALALLYLLYRRRAAPTV